MIPVLNGVGTHCAVLGNHDFGKLRYYSGQIDFRFTYTFDGF